jgi:hypothetical protein
VNERCAKAGITIAAILVAMPLVASCGAAHRGAHYPHLYAAPAVSLSTRPDSYWGLYGPGAPASYAPVAKFAGRVHAQPKIALYFSGWGEAFRTSFAEQARRHGAVTLVQIDPSRVNVSQIAAGRYNSYLNSYANQVRAYRFPVIISFGHEMNGSWYGWSWKWTTPLTFISAWRHIVSVFRQVKVRNVTWMWTVNRSESGTRPILEFWPGASYVTWIGIDGYWLDSSESFQTLFGETVIEVRHFSSKPILIAETAVGPIAGPSKITDLFSGVRMDRLLGLVWFDKREQGGYYHQDWRLEDDPAALSAFRRAVAKYGK